MVFKCGGKMKLGRKRPNVKSLNLSGEKEMLGGKGYRKNILVLTKVKFFWRNVILADIFFGRCFVY